MLRIRRLHWREPFGSQGTKRLGGANRTAVRRFTSNSSTFRTTCYHLSEKSFRQVSRRSFDAQRRQSFMVRLLKIHSQSQHHQPHAATLPDRAYLEITRGTAKRPMRSVREPVYLIGRSHDCDLVLGDAQFGDVPAYLFPNGDQLSLRWLGDGPEVTVNGEKSMSTVLHDEDRIRTGPFEFFVHICPAKRRPVRAEIRKAIRMHSAM